MTIRYTEAEATALIQSQAAKRRPCVTIGAQGEHVSPPGPPASVPGEPESALQGKIQKWADDHGFPCQCNRRSRKAKGFLTPGWFD